MTGLYGLVALYDIRLGNGSGPFLQPRSPHGACCMRTSCIIMPHPLGGGIKQRCCLTSDVCRTSGAYIVNIHGVHSYWKQGALGAAGQA